MKRAKKTITVDIDEKIEINETINEGVKGNNVKIKIIPDSEMFIPRYHSEEAMACDLVANITEVDLNTKMRNIRIPPRGIVKVDVGIRIQPEPGWDVQILPRSGDLSTRGVQIVNSPGAIDRDFTGRLFVKLINNGKEIVVISHGDRIAQMRPVQKNICDFEVVENFDSTVRGDNGDGSTGK